MLTTDAMNATLTIYGMAKKNCSNIETAKESKITMDIFRLNLLLCQLWCCVSFGTG